jgi:hypothetical protein
MKASQLCGTLQFVKHRYSLVQGQAFDVTAVLHHVDKLVV